MLCDAVVRDSEGRPGLPPGLGRQPGGTSHCQQKPVQIRRFQKEIWSMATPHYGYPGIFPLQTPTTGWTIDGYVKGCSLLITKK